MSTVLLPYRGNKGHTENGKCAESSLTGKNRGVKGSRQARLQGGRSRHVAEIEGNRGHTENQKRTGNSLTGKNRGVKGSRQARLQGGRSRHVAEIEGNRGHTENQTSFFSEVLTAYRGGSFL